MIPCYKEHGTSFIWYYYRYHIPTAILDLDPDLCQNFLFLLTFVNSAHRGMYNTSKESCVQGLDFIFLHLRALSNLWGRYDPKNEKKAGVFACNCVISSHRIKCNACIESFYEGLHFFFLH